jgi:hypothetical protein
MKVSFKGVAELTGKTSPWQVTVLILIKHHLGMIYNPKKQDVSRAIEKKCI